MRRLHQALDSESYHQVGFNYNEDENGHKAPCEDSQSPKQSEGSQEEDQAFVPPPELEIPEGMIVPETQKLNAIITKTALFISRQGSQMEILIKAKQANNPQFAFLSIDEPLHQYYRYVLDAIKSGKYNPEKQPEKEESEPEEESDADDEPYLHPSLAPSFTKIEAAPSIPSIQYKPSADCAYSMLVNKITGKPPPSKVPQTLDTTVQLMPSAGYYHPMPQQNYSYATPMQYSHGPVIYGPNGQIQSSSQLNVPSVPLSNDTTVIQASSPKDTPSPLVPYGIPSQKPLSRPSFIVPPADVQIIIDKMASYVAKNGRDFETIVKNKGDPRFNFLELSHQYHGYYAHKLTIYEGAINPKVLTEEELLQKQEPQEEKQKKLEELQKKQQRMEEVQKRVKMIQAKKKGDPAKVKQSSQGTKQITTVSFSIKKPKDGESTVIEKRNALPLEESDEEMDNDKKDASSKPGSPQDVMDTNLSSNAVDKDPSKSEKKLKSDDKELVDLTDDILEDCQKEIRHRQAEDRIKDKLVAAARDKLAATSREKQLQLERRKKAAMFLSQIQAPALKPSSVTTNSSSRRDDLDDVRSVPSPSLEDNNRSQDMKACGNSLMDRLKSADLSGSRSRKRSRSRSGSRSDRHKLHKKHKKKKSSHRSSYDSSSSARSHRPKKSKKSSSRHRSRSHSPSHRHQHNSRRRNSHTSHSDSSSP
ncbi:splicing factor, suppressor of white-apricot homolog isoform X3 [Odontomachus brunneus]|nr:splicing factor, suppressor of white-apricot homolog isoform X3 [Odontomachus brunneus]